MCFFVLLMFSINGFSNALSFSNIENDTVAAVEHFIRDDFLLILENKCQQEKIEADETIRANFFGAYAKNTNLFRFHHDEKSLIQGLAEHVNRVINTKGLDNGLTHFHGSMQKTVN